MAREEGKANTQSRRFIETARELGCEEDPKAFERALKRITKPKKDAEKKPDQSKRGEGGA